MYINKETFLMRYPLFKDRTDQDLETSISDAESVVKSYISNRFSISGEFIPQILIRITSDLTCYFLQKSNLQAISEDGHQRLYKNAIQMLEDIVNGIIKIETAEEIKDSDVWIKSAEPFGYINGF